MDKEKNLRAVVMDPVVFLNVEMFIEKMFKNE